MTTKSMILAAMVAVLVGCGSGDNPANRPPAKPDPNGANASVVEQRKREIDARTDLSPEQKAQMKAAASFMDPNKH